MADGELDIVDEVVGDEGEFAGFDDFGGEFDFLEVSGLGAALAGFGAAFWPFAARHGWELFLVFLDFFSVGQVF